MSKRTLGLLASLAAAVGAVAIVVLDRRAPAHDAAAPAAVASSAPGTRVSPPPPPPSRPSLAIPTREQLGYPTTPVLREPDATQEVAPPHVVADLDDVRVRLRERARGCANVTGRIVELQVDVALHEGEAVVREAILASRSPGDDVERCVQQAVKGQRWPVASPNKQFGLHVRLEM